MTSLRGQSLCPQRQDIGGDRFTLSASRQRRADKHASLHRRRGQQIGSVSKDTGDRCPDHHREEWEEAVWCQALIRPAPLVFIFINKIQNLILGCF